MKRKLSTEWISNFPEVTQLINVRPTWVDGGRLDWDLWCWMKNGVIVVAGVSLHLSLLPDQLLSSWIVKHFCSQMSRAMCVCVRAWVHVHAQLCPTLCNPMDCSPPGSYVHGTSQARILEWVAISFLRGSSQPRDRTRIGILISCVSCIGRQILYHCTTREVPFRGRQEAKRLTSVLYEQLNRQANKRSFWWKEMRGQGMDFSNMRSPCFSLARIDERQS